MRFLGSKTPTNTPKQSALSVLHDRQTASNHSVFDSLSDEQKVVLEEIKKGHSVVVDACIGSGKTRCLQALVDEFPFYRILYLTYNRLLKLDAQDKIQNRNATVQNYHGFVYKYLVRKNIRCTPDKQIKTFLEKCGDVPLIYDLIAVDEYQDLEEDTCQLLLHIKKECPNAQWVFVGDMQQKIYDKTKIDVYKDCIEKVAPDYVPLTFTQSFRISAEHGQFLSSMWQKNIVGVNSNCKVDVIQHLDEMLEILDKIPNKDVLILGPRYGLTQELVNILERHDSTKYNKRTVWTSIRDRDENFQIQPNSLIVTTYDGCKGMERPVCIVIDWTNEHYRNRVEKPFVDQTIITNLFCVAASRGKDRIIFFKDPLGKAQFLQQNDLTLSYTQELPDYNPSTMFDFKHPVDIARCMDDLEIEDIEQEDKTVIEADKSDANIDLSPAIGVFQEIIFFKNYNFERALSQGQEKPILSRIRKWVGNQSELSAEQKALAITAYETELFRYCNQVKKQFMTPTMQERLRERLSSKLDSTSKNIQVPCHVIDEFSAFGFIDYLDKEHNIPWELKFVGNLENSNYLQTAMYIIARKSEYGYLWNTRTNELKKIKVKDREKFLEDVYTCITMGRKLRRF